MDLMIYTCESIIYTRSTILSPAGRRALADAWRHNYHIYSYPTDQHFDTASDRS